MNGSISGTIKAATIMATASTERVAICPQLCHFRGTLLSTRSRRISNGTYKENPKATKTPTAEISRVISAQLEKIKQIGWRFRKCWYNGLPVITWQVKSDGALGILPVLSKTEEACYPVEDR